MKTVDNECAFGYIDYDILKTGFKDRKLLDRFIIHIPAKLPMKNSI